MHPAPVDRLAQRRRYRRTGERSIAAAILLHLLAIAALLIFVRSETPQNDAAPSEVALLFEGGLRQSSPLPATERPSQAPLPSPTPGADTENSPSSSPPPPAEASAPTPPEPVLPLPPVPPSLTPPTVVAPSPETANPVTAAPAPASPAEGPSAAASPPDLAGTAPPPTALASREPAAVTAHAPVARPNPPRPQPRPSVRPSPRQSPRFTPDGFPTSLFGSTDLSAPSAARHAANAAPPKPAQKTSAASDIHGGEDLGSDWLNEFSAYVERHKRYPEQAAENNDEGNTTVQIVVNRDGHVDGRDVDLVGRSGSQWLDLGLMAMFRGARLPPFPPGTPHDRETITVTMHYFLIR